MSGVWSARNYTHHFDEDHGVTWHRPRQNLPSATDDIYLYFGGSERGLTEPMLLIQRIKMEGDVAFRIEAEADGRTRTLVDSSCIPAPTVQNHDHTPAGAARETTTFGILGEDVATIREVATAEHVVLRFFGTLRTEEREVPREQLESMRNVIAFYEVLTGKPWTGVEAQVPNCK